MDRLPLIVQSDRTLLLEVNNPLFEEARDSLVGFAELVKSPEHVHTYRISSLSLWNAVASGLTPPDMLSRLSRYAQYPIPPEVAAFIDDQGRRYGKLRLEVAPDGHGLWLTGPDPLLLTQMKKHKSVEPFLGEILESGFRIDPAHRGLLKQALAKTGWPADDRAGYTPGLPLTVKLKDHDGSGQKFQLRPYQHDAIRSFWGDGSVDRGSGVIVLPCGAGKTLVGLGAMEKVQAHTLILTTSLASLHQWRDELLDKTSLKADDIGEYSARVKSIKPVTLTTYQLLSHRIKGEYAHFHELDSHDWGLIIYDEVHLLPAPVFRLTASLQARRRLGLTATLIREDGHSDDVFSLIGPKRFDMAWKELEQQGWIAQASCREIRVSLPQSWRERYASAEDTDRARIAASNPAKIGTILEILADHPDDHILIIGQYLDQLEQIQKQLNAPIITGKTPPPEREKLYHKFRTGKIPVLIVSKVANFSIDLPDANVAIQVSGAFGSRQEEAQRLGRILRPKKNRGAATFYTIVSEDTKEQDFAQKRQLFLCEQGYRYDIAHADETGAPRDTSQQVIQFPRGI